MSHRPFACALLASVLLAGAGEAALAGERYLLSDGAGISFYTLRQDKLVEGRSVMLGFDWHGPGYPAWRKSTGTIIFAGFHGDGKGSSIFEAPLEPDAQERATLVVPGYAPSLSPDESLLAYTTRDNDLVLRDLATGESRTIDRGVAKAAPAVWIDQARLLYRLDVRQRDEQPEDDLVLADIQAGTRERLPFAGLVPSAKVPGREEVLCGSYWGRGISLLDLKTRSVRPLVESHGFSFGDQPLLRPNDRGFLYTRQNFGNWLKLLPEARSYYPRDWEGNEIKVKDIGELSGGFALDGD